MPHQTIFCPNCDTLILDAKHCHKCGWARPLQNAKVGHIAWASALETRLTRNRGGGGARPAAVENTVIVPTEKGELVTLASDAENHIKWRHKLDKDYRSDYLSVWQNKLVLGGEYSGGYPQPRGSLIVLDAETHREAWRIQLDGASVSTPAIRDNIAFCTVNTNKLYAINLAKQEITREISLPNAWLWSPSPPAVTDEGIVVISGRANSLLAFTAKLDKSIWNFDAEGWFPHTPVIVDRSLYIRCWDRRIYALDIKNGKEQWHFDAPRDFSSDIWVSGNFIYVGVKEGKRKSELAYALYTLDRKKGKQVNRYEVPGHIYGRPVANDRAVYFATDERSMDKLGGGTLYALNADGSNLLWHLSVSERFQTDLILANNNVIAGTREGVVYAVAHHLEEDTLESPAFYLAQNAFETAAASYALTEKNYIAAAKLYADKLNCSYCAAQLYLHAKQPQSVINLLSDSQNPKERALVLEAIDTLPSDLNKAKALSTVKAHSRAAKLYETLGEFELAGDCYVLAKEMEDALKSYKKAGATQKRRPLLKKLKRLGEIIPELLESKDYIQVAKIYEDIGEYLKAGYYFDRAKKHALALNAFKQIQPNETLNEKDHRFIAHLAEALNDPEFAIDHYQAIEAFNEAANVTQSIGDNERTLAFYQLAGNDFRHAETLERLQRFDEAAILFTKLRKPLRAAENWIKQVDKKIDAETGIRYLKHDPEIITWLTKAKNLFEEEMTFNSAQAEYCTMYIGKCQITLAKIRREPALRLEMTADPLKYMQGNQVFVTVNNTGWGSTESLALSIKSDHIDDMSATYIGVLQPKQQWRQTIAGIVPKISGTINLSMELINQTTGESVYHSAPEMARVVQLDDPISRFANNNQPIQLKIEKYVVGGMEINDSVINRSNIGSTGDSTPSNEFDSAIVSRAELNRQLSARRALETSKILCPQCGESIADDAKFCHHCGCVINGSKKEGDK